MGSVGSQTATGAVRHGESRDGVRPNAQFVEIKAGADVDLLRVGGAGALDAARV